MSQEPTGDNDAAATPTIWAELDRWAKTLALWQQYIIGTATSRAKLAEADVDVAYGLFLQAKNLSQKQDGEQPPKIPNIAGRPSEPLSAKLVLTRVDGLAGINAIPSGAELTFCAGLTVVYGANGSGKSGFARLLANACFSRQKPQIIGDIYAEGEQPPPAARFHITIGDSTQSPIDFPTELDPCPLKRITVFDAAVARHHITQAAAFEFKPAGFDVFPEMVRVYGLLTGKLEQEIAKRTRVNDFSQSFLGGDTEVHAAIEQLGAKTDLAALRVLAKYGEVESARFTELDTQILALRTRSPKEVLAGLKEGSSDISSLRGKITSLAAEFSETSVDSRIGLIAAARDALSTASTLGTDQFRQPFFNAVGTPEWEQFATSAHALARREGAEYATEEDRCLLCERPLDTPSREHINALLAFVEGDARKRAAEAQDSLTKEDTRLRALDLNIFSDASRVRTHLHRLAPGVEKLVEASFASLVSARDTALSDLSQRTEASKPFDPSDVEEQLTALAEQVAADITRLETDNTEEAIASLDKERRTLRHRQVLSQLLPKIEAFVADAVWAARATSAKGALNTRPITDKEKDLFTQIVGDGYRDRLAEECKHLDCHVPIELQTVGRSGKTMRSLAIRGGHKPEAILSEGEQKAVALADFLTEVALNPASASIVLDDPVTSQDHQRKERIALRLVSEAASRQVIVFTHDLVFLNQLFVAADAEGCELEGHWVDRTHDGRPGLVALGDSPVKSKTYESTTRAKEALAQAQTVVGSPREDAIRKGMGALRTTLEELVVRRLFKEAVSRWSDQVRVTTLRRVNWDNDKVEEICALYEDLSRHIEGHSHTAEASGAPAQMSDLEDRIRQVDQLIKWAKPDRPN